MLSTKKTQTASHLGALALLSLLAISLLSLPAAAQKVNVTYLTSDIPAVSANTDANLVNPWGMSISPVGPWWISDNATGLSTLYNSSGQIQGLVVTIPSGTTGTGTPSGTVFNGNSNNFKINGTSASFLFCTEDGTISGWSSGTTANIAINNNSNGAVYKGMTIATAGGASYLYVANFHSNAIEVYDANFATHSFGSGAFVDSTIPSGYAPFNVQLIGTTQIVVTYAKQDAAKHDDVPGAGNGYVDVYDTQGNLQFRLAHNLYFNAPWGVALAPASGFNGFNGDILIGNFGSGSIMAFNPTTGVWIGNMFDVNSLTLRIDGLWGLTFGNGHSGGPANTLFFTAGPYGEVHGLFGSITPHPGMD